MPKILVIGACGQIGSELTSKLRETHGTIMLLLAILITTI